MSVENSGATVLVVDDEPNLRRVLSAVLTRDGHSVIVADGGRDAVKKAKQLPHLDLLVTDFLMPDMNGLEVLEAVRKHHPAMRTLLISGHGTIRSAVEAMRLGAFDFLTKPFEVEQVRTTVERALRADTPVPPLPAEILAANTVPVPKEGAVVRTVLNGSSADALPATPGLIGDAPATRLMKERLLRAAASKATVLLLGESGTGKEVAARLLHEASPRKRGPFVAVSCAALPETLLESELFGHEKSAFTGAMAAKPGRFELADGGTLFLDEIGDIPHMTQVKLLRALQEREISRIGGVKAVRVDVRLVAATNRDLWQAVQDGTFRLDLYYRLHVIPVTLPPLRERRDDIAALAQHFLTLSAKTNGRSFADGLSADTVRVLSDHYWPGNIRELQNVMEYAVVMAPPGASRIEAEMLPELTKVPAAAPVVPMNTPVLTTVAKNAVPTGISAA
jgi:two-component system, NtrC family, response regulator AtoC